jgi:threonine dehydrogenase-like Zn-dependent dehydrogenase
MKALVKWGDGKENMGIREMPEPGNPGPGEILVEVMCVGICGSDLHIWRDEKEHKRPVILGHEYSGRVMDIGPGCDRIRPGDRICGDLETLGGRIGTHVNGAYASQLIIPEALAHIMPESVSYEEGAMVELITCMSHTLMHRSRINPSDYVVVLGPGPIGLTLTQLVKLWSPRFVLTTGLYSDEKRLEMARELGADMVYYSEDDPVKVVKEMTGGLGAEFIIDATGGEDAISQATRMARMGGWISIVGLWGHNIRTNLDLVPYHNLTVRGGWGWAGMESESQAVRMAAGFESWEKAIQILALGRLDMTKMITRKILLEEWYQSFCDLEEKKEVKVMVYPNPDKYWPDHNG